MVSIGYTMMCEQSPPDLLVRDIQRAEDAGFDFSVISDHFNPWLEEQGHSGYAWSILGAASQVTSRIPLMTYVTCPLIRYHPISYDVSKDAASKRAHEQFRWTGLGWPVNSELPTPAGFASASASVRPEDIAEQVACGPDVDHVVDKAKAYVDAGFTELALVQIGADQQEAFCSWAEKELLPALRSL
ncbi:LLM class flavin-dependent oxidoreductase [Intrasporangium chromatireducens]|uniref:LLM class flavin-dependent oxidoreductase n=1 Tax=Intrasporangium chromatireducens TaxID=1386088 RepID=UPI0004ADC136|nr:LLM class flavin-dependent oxidoreductase [Intrasporangium chromatireducens]